MKTVSILILTVLVMLGIYWRGASVKNKLLQQEQVKAKVTSKIQWVYCWRVIGSDPEISGEGKAFNLKFDEKGEILSFLVRWKKGETKYSRSSSSVNGSCSPKNGTWELRKLSHPNEYGGLGTNEKGEKLEMYLFAPEPKLDLSKLLGPEWKKWVRVDLVPEKWTKVYKTRNGSDWKVVQGEIWVKAGNKKPVLDKPGGNIFVGGRTIRFYPKTNDAILFFKY